MAKRPAMDLNLDVSTLQSRAVEQPDPVQTAVAETRKPLKLAKKVSEEPSSPRRAPATDREPSSSRQKSRVGKVSVQTWVPNETRRRLKVLAAQTDVSIEEYLAQAIDEILAQHKM